MCGYVLQFGGGSFGVGEDKGQLASSTKPGRRRKEGREDR